MTVEQGERIIAELVALKKLEILSLMDRGFSQSQIAAALGTNQQAVSRMVPASASAKSKKKG